MSTQSKPSRQLGDRSTRGTGYSQNTHTRWTSSGTRHRGRVRRARITFRCKCARKSPSQKPMCIAGTQSSYLSRTPRSRSHYATSRQNIPSHFDEDFAHARPPQASCIAYSSYPRGMVVDLQREIVGTNMALQPFLGYCCGLAQRHEATRAPCGRDAPK